MYKAHRLAWLYITGQWPIDQIDHINGIRSDNRFCNLREIDLTGNSHQRNKPPKNNKSGFIGVYLTRSGKFRAQIGYLRTNIAIGVFDTPEQAHAAYLEAKKKYHPKWIPVQT